MKKEIRNAMKDIMQNKALESSIPMYGNAYVNSVFEYGMIRLVLTYYTMKEVEEEVGAGLDDYLSGVLENIHTILFESLLSDGIKSDSEDMIWRIDSLRNEMTQKMTLLTAYTDGLQLHEYVLNRIEYAITGEKKEVEESELAAQIFQYLFSDNDKMVVNSKIQLVTGQLPIRMTKNRFYDYLTDTLNIYTGSEKNSFDDFVSMLKSTALLELPDGYGKEFKEIADVIKVLEDTNYKTLSLEEYQGLMEQFSLTTDYLSGLVSNYLFAMEIINNLYVVLLAKDYANETNENVDTCLEMLKGLHNAYISAGSIPDSVDEGFMKIEGRQEELGEEIMQLESILPDVISQQKEAISWMMTEQIFTNLTMISKLLSNSMFVDLKEEDAVVEITDSVYISQKRDELVKLLTEYFENHTKEMNRAVMASLFSCMPVLFNSQQEIKEYIEYSLNHCNNDSELMACAGIIEDLMTE